MVASAGRAKALRKGQAALAAHVALPGREVRPSGGWCRWLALGAATLALVVSGAPFVALGCLVDDDVRGGVGGSPTAAETAGRVHPGRQPGVERETGDL